jgi:hypothetical protein
VWRSIEKYQSTTKVWTPARQLVFFFVSLLARIITPMSTQSAPTRPTDIAPTNTSSETIGNYVSDDVLLVGREGVHRVHLEAQTQGSLISRVNAR